MTTLAFGEYLQHVVDVVKKRQLGCRTPHREKKGIPGEDWDARDAKPAAT